MPRKKKASVFIRCSHEEAELIRQAANMKRQTVSRYILDTVFDRPTDEQGKFQQEVQHKAARRKAQQ